MGTVHECNHIDLIIREASAMIQVFGVSSLMGNMSFSVAGLHKSHHPSPQPAPTLPEGGYDDEIFLSPPPDDLQCSICLLTLMDPHLFSCCGVSTCEMCMLRSDAKRECPRCRTKDPVIIEDKKTRGRTMSLKVQCTGCDWRGELIDYKKHVTERCVSRVVQCGYGCGLYYKASDVAIHQEEECTKRPYDVIVEYYERKIRYLDEKHSQKVEGLEKEGQQLVESYKQRINAMEEERDVSNREHIEQVQTLKEKHSQQVERLEKESEQQIEEYEERLKTVQEEMDNCKKTHADEICSLKDKYTQHIGSLEEKHSKQLQSLQDKLKDESKAVKVQRTADLSKIKKHKREIEESREKILELSSKVDAHGKKNYPDWYSPIAITTSLAIPPCIRAMTNYTQHKVKGDSWYSAPFYTRQGGYKLQLIVDANGARSGIRNNCLSVAVHLMGGDNDDCLGWPFKGSINVKLLNWIEDDNHLEHTFTSHSLDRVPKGTIGPSPVGIRRELVSHKQLTAQCSPDCQTQYLMEDVLCFVISSATVLSGYRYDLFPVWCHNDLPSDNYGVLPVYRSITTGLNLRKACSSDPFYTSKGGYKVTLCVDPTSSKGTQVDVGVCLMKGPNDDDLPFPLTGIFTVQLLNWKRNDQNKELPIEFDDSTPLRCRERVIVGERAECWGEHQFISRYELKNGTTEQYRSYDRDKMCFKISYEPLPQIIDGATVPTWYKHDAHSAALPCIRTFDNFSVYKKTNATWWSQPFYTSAKNGYKLQLKVYANGDRSGAGTHLSLFVYLMKGEHDDKLSWPFNDNITVQLLNWRSDNGHKEMTIRFHIAPLQNCQKVSGAPSGGFGSGQFISHTQLFDCATVNYVNSNDMACFRIISADVDTIDWY